MKKKNGKWMAALLLGVCVYFSFGAQVSAKAYNENTAYRIIDVNSGKPVGVEDGDFNNGAAIELCNEKEGRKEQMFFLESKGDFTVIKAAHSMGLLTVKKSSFKDFAEIAQYQDEGLKSMEWTVIDNGDGTVSFKNRNSDKMLDVSGGEKKKGTRLQQYRADGTDSQKFRLEKVSVEEMCKANKDSTHILKPEVEKLYRIVNAASGKVFDVRDSSTENGAVFQLWSEKEGNENQMFRFRSQGNGYYSVIVRNSHKALEVGGASRELGAGLNQWTHIDDYDNHEWKLISLGNDKFILCNRNSGMVADVYSGDLSNGTQLTQYVFNGSKAQIFELEEVDRDEYK